MTLALTGLQIWDGVGNQTQSVPQSLRIERDRIVGVGSEPSLVAESRVVPLDGCTAIPGLIDAHVHLTLDPAIMAPRDQLRVPRERLVAGMEGRAQAMVRAGITTARDLGGGEGLEIALRDRIAAGETPGPRLLCAGQPITSPGGHCHFWGGEARGALGIDAVVKRQIERDCDWIKVMATGGVMTRGTSIGSTQFSHEELEHVVRAARENARDVAAHCHGTRGIAMAASAGVRTVEHCSFAGGQGFGSDYDPAVVDQLAVRGAQLDTPLWVSPTCNAGWARLSRNKRGEPSGFGMRMARALQGLRAAGVPIIASTDAGIPRVEHHLLPKAIGVMAHLAGMEPVEALRAATSASADALGVGDETGRLRKGMCADVLVVEGDPTRELDALLRPVLVVSRGEIVLDVRDQRAAG